jgi:acyl carrier protein phosphodiesterase
LNFLAHLHLSAGTPASMFGGIVADHLKQPDVLLLPADVQEGVRLHRLIDSYTDSHIVVRKSIGRLSANWQWFSGIIVDIYYDHILARDWSRYSNEPLRAFADRSYRALEQYIPIVHVEAAGNLRRIIETDRLMLYASASGIEDTLARVSDRIEKRMPKHARRLELAMPDLLANVAGLSADFHLFYPELVRFSERCKAGE